MPFHGQCTLHRSRVLCVRIAAPRRRGGRGDGQRRAEAPAFGGLGPYSREIYSRGPVTPVLGSSHQVHTSGRGQTWLVVAYEGDS